MVCVASVKLMCLFVFSNEFGKLAKILFKVQTQQTESSTMMKCCIDPVLDLNQDNH